MAAALDQASADELVRAWLASEDPRLQRAIAERHVTVEDLHRTLSDTKMRPLVFANVAYGYVQALRGTVAEP